MNLLLNFHLAVIEYLYRWRCAVPLQTFTTIHVTFFGGSEDLCLLRWQNLKACCARSFGGSIHYRIIMFSVFAKVPGVFVPNAISHYGRPSRFVLIRFNARRLDYSASLLVPHNLES